MRHPVGDGQEAVADARTLTPPEAEGTQAPPGDPDLEHAKAAVINSLTSRSAQRTYEDAIREFVAWYRSEPRLAFNRTVVLRYRFQQHYAAVLRAWLQNGPMTSLARFVAIGWMLPLWLAAPQAFAQAGANGSAPASEEIFRPGGDVIAPRVIHEDVPQYTSDAMRHCVRGDVVVECTVTREGVVTTDCTVLASLGHGLDENALAAARLSRFAPGTMKGRPVNVRITITNTFALDGCSLPQTLRPSGAPIDATATCTDGTFSWATTQSMACLAHAGVAAWWDAAPPRKQ